MKPVLKSSKLAHVLYDVRGPIVEAARQMEDEGQKIIKLNIGNLASFGFEPPEEIVEDMIHNLPTAQGYSDSAGIYEARTAVAQFYQAEGLRAVGRHDDARRVRHAVLDALCQLELIPELYACHAGRAAALAVAQPQQAWSSGAVVSFLAAEADD